MRLRSTVRRLLARPFVVALLAALCAGLFLASTADAHRRGGRWKHRHVRYVHRPVVHAADWYPRRIVYRERVVYRPRYVRYYEPGWSFSIGYSNYPRVRYARYYDPYCW